MWKALLKPIARENRGSTEIEVFGGRDARGSSSSRPR